MEFIDLILYFVVYSFMGWLMETAFAGVIEREFVNRGFLIGPFCPIYGFGAVLIILCSAWLRGFFENNLTFLIISIIMAIVLTTLLEMIVGAMLEKLMNRKWWDYGDKLLNFHGYICLQYSLLWGVLAFLTIEVIHPSILILALAIPLKLKIFATIIVLFYFFIDTTKSVMSLVDLKKAVLKNSSIWDNKYFEKVANYLNL
jgi:uncharacterized membrane protein